MKLQMSLAAVTLAFALASACAQDKAPSKGGTEPATEQPANPEIPHDDVDPDFDPSASPADVDKDSEPGSVAAGELAERKATFTFDVEKLTGHAGEAVVLTIDHKKVASSSKCATPIEHTPISESGYDPEATTLVVEVVSRAAVADESSDTVQPDFEVLEHFTFSCGKSPLSVTMQNMDTGHQIKLSLTVHTKDSTVYAEAKPFVALNTSDADKALTLDYPNTN